ncbi:MAG TPA: hypothetical protein VF997_04795, partial [Polyangia bacterium]
MARALRRRCQVKLEDPTVTTVRRDWVGDEAELPRMWGELKRLGRRARRRWLRTLGYGLLCAGLVVGTVARKPRSYASRVAFRVSESELESATTMHTNGRLRDYVATVVFSTARLKSVIKEHELYVPLMQRDPSLAVESMRDDLEVEVWRNYFALPRSADDPARSARLAITFHSNDAHKAYDTVTHLGRLVAESEQRSRVSQAESALRLADDQVETTQKLVQQRRRDIIEKQLQRDRAREPAEAVQLLVEQRSLEKALPRAEKLLAQAEARREQLYMRAQLEKHALGIRWELIDPGR